MRGARAVVTAPGQVALEAYEPSRPGAGQVILRARRTLISPGTERAFYLGLDNTDAAYPLYPGYSFIGEVEACGAGVTTLRAGDRVASAAQHASHTVVDSSACHTLPDALSDEEAAFFNLLAIAMQGVRKARIELGESVVVLGAGIIGILALRLAQLSGGLPVIGVDLDADRLALARRVGADDVIPGSADLAAELDARLGDAGADVVIEATGAPQLVVTAFQLAADRGRVVLLGSPRGRYGARQFLSRCASQGTANHRRARDYAAVA